METGRCYELTTKVMLRIELNEFFERLELDNLKVVHGIVTIQSGINKGKRMGHAWLESDEKNQVIDLGTGIPHLINKELYYKVGNVEQEKNIYYNKREIYRLAILHGNCGPWEDNVSPEKEWLSEMAMGH